MKLKNARGFLLLECLIAMVILTVGVATCLGAMGQALKLTNRIGIATHNLAADEQMLWKIESGQRPDLTLLQNSFQITSDNLIFIAGPKASV